ncbi:MAG: hypoxanthine phosphoribosyltransferase [Verrucomicrobia bacterium GWF2_51_19]|nr:MAG: hypoxanthine phosphoribosyltransferase [Verrucomicrobia bacterium GWF2_51_19]HCJ12065.1 hypoxanthine phosphoribosyltransferase [Opitutae bacterium]
MAIFPKQPTIEVDLERILLTNEQIQTRLKELGATITAYYRQRDVNTITLVCITNGSIVFVADLMRYFDMHVRLDSMRISSYLEGTSASRKPQLAADISLDIRNEHVLVLDDILDTGHTLTKVLDVLGGKAPASVEVCVLLDKKERREVPIQANFVGFEIPNAFVVGYGLDFDQKYRNLACIGVLKH